MEWAIEWAKPPRARWPTSSGTQRARTVGCTVAPTSSRGAPRRNDIRAVFLYSYTCPLNSIAPPRGASADFPVSAGGWGAYCWPA